MPPASLAGTVHESKTQRQERLKSRFRDRGGIFVPSEGNVLVDILLSRGVNGESPIKKRAPRKKPAVTPKTRRTPSSAIASRVLGSTTPRTNASKRASRKSAAAPSGVDENKPLPAKKRHGTSKRTKSADGRRTPGMDTGTCAGPSRPRATAQRVPFANQLADAINSTKTRIPDSSSTSEKVKPPVTPAPSQSEKSEGALGKRSSQAAAALPRYASELDPPGSTSEYTTGKIKSPLFLLLEKRQRQKADAQRRTGKVAASEPVETRALCNLDGSESDESDVPLAIKAAKRIPAVAESHTKANKGKGSVPPPPTKRRSKAKAFGLGVDQPDEAAIRTETMGSLRMKKGGVVEVRDADPDRVTLAERRRRTDVDADQLPPPTTRAGANSSGRKKAQVLQEKSGPPTNAPRKRKERIKTLLDPTAKDENEHEPPRKKSRRAADPSTRSRGWKENKEMSRSACEAATIVMDKPLPSPMKQPAVRSKPASNVKKPSSSRAAAAQAPRSRGLPLDVLRRIKVNAQALPALNDIDDDDPIDFLRS